MKKQYFSKAAAAAFVVIILLAAAIPALGAAEKARVFVTFAPGGKGAVQQALKAAGAEFHYTFDNLNSFVVTVPAKALEGISHNPNVVEIEEDPLRYPVSATPSKVTQAATADTVDKNGQIIPWGVDAVQARDVWDVNRNTKFDRGAPTGEGITVCIIDTGFYADHEDLARADLIGGISLVDDDYTRDGDSHGTHVAGTIAAQNNKFGVVGVAPETSLFIIKYFGDDGLYVQQQHASDLVAAAYNCADNGADIISMSLSGTHSNAKEEMTFDDLYAQGVLSIGAASNDGIEEYHYPASYDSVISVAAVDEDLVVADFSQFNDQVELAAPGVNVLSTTSYLDVTTLTVGGTDYFTSHVEFSAQNTTVTAPLVDGDYCFTSGDWTGMIVLCERGDTTFAEKVAVAEAGGAVGVIIYNNIDEMLYATLGDVASSSSIIAVSVSMIDGQYLVTNELGTEATISNTYTVPASGYEAWGGTSMATPHVSAVAALVWSAHPDATNVQIREALVETAIDLGDPGRDVYYGFGLVQAADAIDYLLNTP